MTSTDNPQPPDGPRAQDGNARRSFTVRAVLLAGFLGAVLLLASLSTLGETAVSGEMTISGETMGTTYQLVVSGLPEDEAASVRSAVDTELARISRQMSTYQPDTEISRFNAAESGRWFAVSREFVEVLWRAREISQESNGALDVTVAPLVNRWGFGPSTRADSPAPSDAEIAQLKERIGFRLLEIRKQPPALRKTRREVQLDVSSIAKGFAVDQLSALLAGRGLCNHLVEIGGEVRVRGRKSTGEPWAIGIEAPIVGQRNLHRVVNLQDLAMATSGDYRNHRELGGRRVSHLLDPRTGAPINHRLASVTVLAEDCATADAWATALMVLGPDDGFNLAQRQRLAASLLVRVEGGFIERSTDTFLQIAGGR